jgi:LPS export ABC transporter protein LptC
MIELMKSKRLTALAFGFISILLLFVNCPSNNKVPNTETLPSQIVTNFKLFESTTGQKQYSLTAEKAYVYDESQKIVVTKPYIVFYNESGNVSSTLVALRGRVNSRNSDLLAQDSVVVRTSDSTILYTDSLVWNNTDRTILTDAWVKIQSKQGLIEGQGLISDAQLKKIEIKSSVTGKSKYEF